MEKTEWMKQVVRAGRDFHVRQEDPQTQYIESFFLHFCYGVFVLAALVGTASFFSHGNRGWSVCRNLIFGHFILVIHECSHKYTSSKV